MRRVDLDIFFFFFLSRYRSEARNSGRALLVPSPLPLSSLRRMEMITEGVPFHKNFDAISTVEKKNDLTNPAQMDVRRMIEHPRIRVPGTTNFIIRVLANFHTKRCYREGRRREGRTEKYRDYRFVFHGASGKLCTVYE